MSLKTSQAAGMLCERSLCKSSSLQMWSHAPLSGSGVNLHNSGFCYLIGLRKWHLNKGRETQVVAVGCGQHCFSVHLRAQYVIYFMVGMSLVLSVFVIYRTKWLLLLEEVLGEPGSLGHFTSTASAQTEDVTLLFSPSLEPSHLQDGQSSPPVEFW